MSSRKAFSIIAIAATSMLLILGLSACSGGSKASASGDLKDTDYCKKYKIFDKDVATDKFDEQLKKLEATSKAKDLPAEVKEDYELIIDGYKKTLADKPISKNEKKYEAAAKRISRHAIEHCDLLESNTKQGPGGL